MDFWYYIHPELAALPIFLCGLGFVLKKSDLIADKLIPAVLFVAGIMLATLWVFGSSAIIGDGTNLPIAIFTGIIQGGICGMAAVGLHQLVKQTIKRDHKIDNGSGE